MAHVGQVKERLTITATVTKRYQYTAPAYGYGYENRDMYILKDDEGNVFKYDTTGCLCLEPEENVYEPANEGDKIVLKGTVKYHTKYKGEPQTVLSRCKMISFVSKGLSPEEKKAIYKQNLLDSITEGDFIYTMPYRQYKESYDDCETIPDSYDKRNSTIQVIVREGRLKPSGVRFQHFHTYRFEDAEAKRVRCVYAVSEENARRRAEKENPENNWVLVEIM